MLGIGSTMKGRDGMTLLYVPAGEFYMGNDSGNSNERPPHTVYLDAFWIDKTEVTVKMYSLCVSAGFCKEPIGKASYTRVNYYGDSKYNNYPVINVNWSMAKDYCDWAERRLPTEAEWEKAARGIYSYEYPWGNYEPDNSLLNYYNTVGDTTQVGKYKTGASPYRALDMAGNVSEWVEDGYDENYYFNSPSSNPLSPYNGGWGVLRGGSWGNNNDGIRSSYRSPIFIFTSSYNIGFRCAMSVTP
jgi:formylglycine-generating enzyme required for sulfatase activity